MNTPFIQKMICLINYAAYTHNPDDDNIRIKNQVYQILLHCPELLYAIS